MGGYFVSSRHQHIPGMEVSRNISGPQLQTPEVLWFCEPLLVILPWLLPHLVVPAVVQDFSRHSAPPWNGASSRKRLDSFIPEPSDLL